MAETAVVEIGNRRDSENYSLRSHSFLYQRATTARIDEALSESGTDAKGLDAGESLGRLSATPKQLIDRAIGPERRESVRVDVRSVEGPQVRCQILSMGGQDVSVLLPRGIFPTEDMGEEQDSPRVGASYNLRMVSEGGIRRPQLTMVPADRGALSEQKARIRALIDSLS